MRWTITQLLAREDKEVMPAKKKKGYVLKKNISYRAD